MAGRPLHALALPAGRALTTAVHEALDGGPAVLPLSPDLRPAELVALLTALRPTRLITAVSDEPLRDGLPVAGDVALVVPTSGSTRTPKGVELSADALLASARSSLRRLDAGDGQRWLCCLPLSHIGGLQVLIRSRLLGTEPVLLPRFDVATVITSAAATDWLALVPTMLTRLLDAGTDLSRWRGILLGGAAPGERLLDRAREAGARVFTTYGMSETAGGCVYDGVPLDGVRIRLGDDGRISIAGPVLCAGYRLAPAPVKGGWLRTSDLGRWAPDGRLQVLGRDDDVLVTGGENVVAGEVASVVSAHPGVAEAVVVGAPDPEWGTRVVAVVVPATPSQPPTLAEVRDHCRLALAPWKWPRQLLVLDSLPLLANGKLDRASLTASAAAPVAPSAGPGEHEP
ncbi:MAG: AMP-binding protein [Actinomycetota bacterium]|nr:AMP-binding protein [Actinomycetota bacterium]